jgi:hypothetical protein
VASTIYNTLQTDDRWSEDDVGYNLAHTITPTGPSAGEHTYRSNYTITFTTGEVAKVSFEIQAKDMLRP